MKDSMDATAVGRAVDPEVFANRKLIRPALNRSEHPRQDSDLVMASVASAAATEAIVPDPTARKRRRPSRRMPRTFITRNRCRARPRWFWCCRTAKKFTA